MIDVNLLNGMSLAYIGDAIYEIYIRKYAISLGYTNVGKLHKFVCKFTSGVSQSESMSLLLLNNFLTDDEINIYKRGRNSHNHSVRKNIDIKTYLEATGFEALLGYLYLMNNISRLEEIITKSIEFKKEGI